MTTPSKKDLRKVLMIAHAFPPTAGSGVFRTLKFVKYLPEKNWLPVVLTMHEKYNDKIDQSLLKEVPESVRVYRTGIIDIRRMYSILKTSKNNNIKAGNENIKQDNTLNKRKHISILGQIKKTINDLLTTPDRFAGWLIPGVIKGLFIIKREKTNVIYCTSPVKTTLLIGLILKIITKKPFVIDFRDPWILPGGTENIEKNKTLLKLESWLEKQVMKLCDMFIANNEYLKKAYIDKYGDIIRSKTIVITNGYDSSDFIDMKRQRSKYDSKLIISHIGEFYEQIRRPDNFLISIDELIKENKIEKNRIVINFIGGGEYIMTRGFNSLLSKYNLKDIVNITTHLSHKESIQYMIDSDILLLLQPSPITRMQIPAKIYEYIRTGNYVLAIAPDSATSEIVNKYKNGIVVAPDAINVMKEKIYELYLKYKKDILWDKSEQQEIEIFNRRILTKKLAKVLSEV